MIERQRRDRIQDHRLPSRLMRSLLREAIFGVYDLRRGCGYGTVGGPSGERHVRSVLALCRRATARHSMPDWFDPLTRTMPQTIPDTTALLDRLLVPLCATDAAWRRRLIAAGIDPKWPGDDA